MITLKMNIYNGKVKVGQRYLAITGPLSGSRIHVSEVYQGGCVLTADRVPHVTPRYQQYHFMEKSFFRSMKGGRDTTADSLLLLNGRV